MGRALRGLVVVLLAACGGGSDPIAEGPPPLVPLDGPQIAMTHGSCVPLGGREVLSVSAEGDAWLIGAGELTVVTVDGAQTSYAEERAIADAFAASATELSFASGGLFKRRGEFVDTIPWPVEDEPTLVCGDPSADRDGFLVAGGSLFGRSGGEWYRWFPAEGEIGDILDVPKALGACRGERGETWLQTTSGLWRLRDNAFDRVAELPPVLQASFGFGFGAAAVTEAGLFVGPEQWRLVEFEAGAPRSLTSGGAVLYVGVGERFYRFSGDGAAEVVEVDFGLPEVVALHPYADGVWVETPGELCDRREHPEPFVVRGVRPFERRPQGSIELHVQAPPGDLVVARDGVMVHEAPGSTGPATVSGVFAGEPGWHRLEVRAGERTRQVRYEVVTNSGATWVEDIEPLARTHCAGSSCHGADRDDPERPDLSTYEGWVDAGRAIRDRVARVGDMPPADARLESWDAEEVALVVAWIDEGMVRGE